MTVELASIASIIMYAESRAGVLLCLVTLRQILHKSVRGIARSNNDQLPHSCLLFSLKRVIISQGLAQAVYLYILQMRSNAFVNYPSLTTTAFSRDNPTF